MFSTDTFAGKFFLITGGGSGLGLSMAKRFAALGAGIAVCGRTPEKLNAAEQELSQFGSPVITHACDVRDYEAVGEMIKLVVKKFGSLDGVINNAAGNFYAASEDLSPNGFKTVIDIVLHGAFHVSQHFGKYLIAEKRGGSILNIVTTYTETGSSFVLPSACAKAGVYAMTTSLAYEWATYGIRVNAIAPGPFPTKGAWSRLMPSKEIEEAYLKRIPAGRYGRHDELSNLAAFVMSDLSPYLTGECITIDGGERLNGGQFNFVTQLAPREELKQFFASLKPKKE